MIGAKTIVLAPIHYFCDRKIDMNLLNNQLASESIKQFEEQLSESPCTPLSKTANVIKRQKLFRKSVFEHNSQHCLITGIDCVDILEVAHIVPFEQHQQLWSRFQENAMNPHNGLILRSDLHGLFKRHLIRFQFDSDNITIQIDPSISYLQEYHNQSVQLSPQQIYFFTLKQQL